MESGKNVSYFIPFLDEIDCLSEQSQYDLMGNRIVKPVLDKDKIGDKAVLRIHGYDKKCIVGRQNFEKKILYDMSLYMRMELRADLLK